MQTDYHYSRGYAGTPPQVHVSFGIMPDPIATFAMQLLLAPGVLVTGDSDGEDSAGRAKAKPPQIRALVERAFDIAASTYEIAQERGLLAHIPTFAEIDEQAKFEKN